MRGLYAICDVAALCARGVDPLAFAGAVVKGRPALLQLRAKDLSAREVLAILRALRPLCRRAGVPLVMNDRVDLALAGGCDMVHVGQDDLPIELVRRIAPSLGVGVSTHTPAQLAAALGRRPTYVAYGPVFTTASKKDAAPTVGLRALSRAGALARKAGIPLVAIGGIRLEEAAVVAAHATMAAVIGDLSAQKTLRELTARARQYHAVFHPDGSPEGPS